MNRPTCAVMVLAGLAAGCELVAGIHDKYLATDGAAPVMLQTDTGVTPGDDSMDGSHTPLDATVPETGDAGAAALDAPSTSPPGDANTGVVDAMGTGGGNDTPPDAGTTDPSAPCSGQPAFKFCDD